jgi:hypothetical protein
VVIGKFGDDFEPRDDKNREIHGPSDGNLYLDSRNLLELFGKTGVEIWGRNVYLYPSSADGLVQLGEGATSTMKPLAVNEEVLADLELLHALVNPYPVAESPFGRILALIEADIPAIAPVVLELQALWEQVTPSARPAFNVVANINEEES